MRVPSPPKRLGFVAAVVGLILVLSQLAVSSIAAGSDATSCLGREATILGTAGDDVLVGTSGDDVIVALGGNDRVQAGAGDDIVCGGDGDDVVMAEAGDDTVRGESGADRLFGQGGDDRLHGGPGEDFARGGPGQDRVIGAGGDDVLFGMPGADVVNGGPGNDEVYGGDDDDTLIGGGGDDIVRGDFGNDIIRGDRGQDILLGSQGRDRLSGGPGADRLAGMTGSDVLSGGDGADRLEGGKSTDQLLGGAGADIMDGGEHGDDCVGGQGADTAVNCEFGEVDGPVGEPGEVTGVAISCADGVCEVTWTVTGPPIDGGRVDLAFGPCAAACETMVEQSLPFDRTDFVASFPEADLDLTTSSYCALSLSDYPEVDGQRSGDTFATACGTLSGEDFVIDGEVQVLNFGSMAITEPEVVDLALTCTTSCVATVQFVDRTEGEDAVSITVRNRVDGVDAVVGFAQIAGATPGRGTTVTATVPDIAPADLSTGELCVTVAAVNQEFGGGRTSPEFCVAYTGP